MCGCAEEFASLNLHIFLSFRILLLVLNFRMWPILKYLNILIYHLLLQKTFLAICNSDYIVQRLHVIVPATWEQSNCKRSLTEGCSLLYSLSEHIVNQFFDLTIPLPGWVLVHTNQYSTKYSIQRKKFDFPKYCYSLLHQVYQLFHFLHVSPYKPVEHILYSLIEVWINSYIIQPDLAH